jgi:hypothetical protein
VALFCLVSIIGAWQVFKRAGEAASAASRASLGMEELARLLSVQAAGQPRTEGRQLSGLRQEAEALLEQERHLQEMSRESLESGGPSAAALGELEMAMGRLEDAVGKMTTSLADIVQLLERR